jgi:hypothetical protein
VNTRWGFVATGSSGTGGDRLSEFIGETLAKNAGRAYDPTGDNTFVTAAGTVIHFVPFPDRDPYVSPIVSVNGSVVARDMRTWPLVSGNIMNSDGHTGYVTIDTPPGVGSDHGRRLVLDYRDAHHPRITEAVL